MRQVRVPTTPCPQPEFIAGRCRLSYSLGNEERRSYAPRWANTTSTNYSSIIRRAFQYQSGNQLDTYVYVGNHGSYLGGGYVYEFRGRLPELRYNISQLRQLGWIDSQTRAVIIQLTLYNPNVQLFTSVLLLAEFLSSTNVDLTARFEPISFHGNCIVSNASSKHMTSSF